MNTPTSDPDCLFCKIAAGSISSRTVYQDGDALAFLDLSPWQRGHTLVIPRVHATSLVSGPPLMSAIGAAIDATARLLMERLDADGLNLVSSAGQVAGQEIQHLHIHLVPRYADRPGLANLVGPVPATTEELDAVHGRLVAGR